ncbi:hypothetical protein AKJ65_05480 [candidate division MSBL1 archaeon SCGC-AAA259E19]|uniref:Uncharacterized protein n=1 Tax=candidate division MSBL1 archaeon SCGC-AAA259E19 TaxID=1698264 RepID=A0A133UJ23_9EURY|nr:hypothetical protein AKJ65_05480 [candidate division MSBL1 archaeon SCGC-AAA259E19]
MIILVAVGWHAGIIGIIRYTQSQRNGPSFKRILRSIEVDLLQALRKLLKKLPKEKSRKPPYSNWLRESEIRLNEIRGYDE